MKISPTRGKWAETQKVFLLLSESMLAHDAVAAALVHKNHPIIHVSAPTIQVIWVYDLHSSLTLDLIFDKTLFSSSIWPAFSCVCPGCTFNSMVPDDTKQALGMTLLDCVIFCKTSVSIFQIGKGKTMRPRDMVKAKRSGEDLRTIGGFVSLLSGH